MDNHKSFTVFQLLIVMVACTSVQNLDREEHEYRERVDRANWDNCAAVYRSAGKPTIHDHVHDPGKPIRRQELLDDLRWNGCKMLLGDEWLDY